ncbi:MAG: potassium transporter TrkG, partial [Christensenellaceae bacterium]
LRYGAFAVLSLTSSTGFSTADFTTWSEFAKSVLLLCMVIGASAGSTGGGLKASRMLILLKAAKAHILRVLRPQSLQIVKMNGKVLSQDEVASVLHYFLIWAGTLIFATLFLSLNGFDFLTNFSSALTCLNNDGPGMTTMVGPFGGFSMFDPYSKIILIFLMIAGRLEIYPFLLLLLPKTWSKKF